jgi:adenylate cyclase
LDDVFEVQDDIARAVVTALKLKIAGPERAEGRRGTHDPKAYELCLMAQRYFYGCHEGDPRSLDAVVRLGERATSIDPDYARAWSLTAAAQQLLDIGHGRGGDAGRALAARALALDPELPEALAVTGRNLLEDGNLEGAQALAERALGNDPDCTLANELAGRIRFMRQQFEAAIPFWERAAAMKPRSTSDASMLICCSNAIGDREGVKRAARMLVDRAEAVLAQDYVNGAAIGCMVGGYAALGDRDRARSVLERGLLIDPDNILMRYNFACGLAVYLQDPDWALDVLEPAFDRMTASFVRHAACDPDFDRLRDHPRFRAMVTRAEARLAKVDTQAT